MMFRYRLILPILLTVAAVAAFATSVQTANVQTANVQTANVQTANVQTANVQTANVQTANVQTANVQTANVQTANVQTANVQTANVQTASTKNNKTSTKNKKANSKTASGQTASEPIANAQTEVVVVVSSRSSVKSLTAEQTTKIFLGKVVTFPNGQAAVPIDQPEGTAVRDEFYAKVVHKNPSQLTAYWAKVIFTGDGRPPSLLPDSVAVIKAIAHDPNAIGYIEKSAVNRSVRVVLEP